MDIEIDEGEAGGEFGDEGDDDDTSALYFSVSLWRAKSLLGNNAGADQGRTRERNSQLQSLISRPFSTRFG
jgi:hypothetical protein